MSIRRKIFKVLIPLLFSGTYLLAQQGYTYSIIDSINSSRPGFTALDNLDRIGRSVCSLGDMDNDGNLEIAFGVPLDDDGGSNAGAVYICDVDTVSYQYQSFVKISATSGGLTGIGAGYRFGTYVDSLGDFDGDGINDLVVGTARDPGNGLNRGSVQLLLLNANGTVKTQHTIGDGLGGFNAPLNDNDFFGVSVTCLGDIDNDGITDIAVGAYKDDDGNTNAGCVYVLLLNQNGTVKSTQKISSLQGGLGVTLSVEDNFGVFVNQIGDMNFDGINDIAVSAFRDDVGGTNTGSVYFIMLNQTGTVKKKFIINNNSPGLNNVLPPNTELGFATKNIGDLDGDNINEFAIGSFQSINSPQDGNLRILEIDTLGNVGDSVSVNLNTSGLASRVKPGDAFGACHLMLDFNPKSQERKFIVGSRFGGSAGTDRGQQLIFSMKKQVVTQSHCYEYSVVDSINSSRPGFTTLDNGDNIGKTICHLGDFDNDGNKEVAIGAPLDDDGGTDAGAIYICDLNSNHQYVSFEKISMASGGLTGVGVNDHFGFSVDSLGDFDGDGIGDMVVGAYRDPDGGSNVGAVYLIMLNANGTVKNQFKISSTQGGFNQTLSSNDFFGFSVASLGDIDGDGITDIAATSRNDDDGNTNAGCAYIIFLNPNGTVKTSQKISSTQGGLGTTLGVDEHFGATVRNVGDINNDGNMEIAISAIRDDAGAVNAGAVYFLSLNPNGTIKKKFILNNNSPGFSNALPANANFGRGIANVGDLDGDGINEYAIGSHEVSQDGRIRIIEVDTNGTVFDTASIGINTPGVSQRLNPQERLGMSLLLLEVDTVVNERIMSIASLWGGSVGTDRGQHLIISMQDTCAVSCNLQTSINNNDNQFCFGDTIRLTSNINNDTAYHWQAAGQTLTSNKDTFLVFQQDTTFDLKLISYNPSCADSAAKQIQVFAPPSFNKFPDTLGCIGDTLQIGVPNPASLNYAWIQGSNIASPNSPVTDIVIPDSSTYILQATDSMATGCSAYDTVVVTGNPAPVFSLGSDTSICFADSVELSPDSTGNHSYLWSLPDGTSLDTTATTKQNVDSAATFILQATSQAQCSSVDSINVFVLPKLNLIVPSDASVCDGDTVNFSIPSISHTSISWSPAIGLTDTNAFTTAAFFSDSTIDYNVRVLDTIKSCDARDTVTVTSNEAQFVNLLDDTVLCTADTFSFDVQTTNNVIYNWSPGVLFIDSTTAGAILLPDSGINEIHINATDTTSGCSDVDSTTLDVINFSGTDIAPTLGFCENDTAEYTIDPSLADQYYWQPAYGLNSEFAQQQLFSLEDTSVTYTIYQIDTATNCYSIDTLRVRRTTNYLALDSQVVSACFGHDARFSAPGGTNYNWSPGHLYSDSTAQTTEIEYEPGADYFVIVTDSNNCSNKLPFGFEQPGIDEPAVEYNRDIDCEGQSLDISLNNFGQYSNISWQVNGEIVSADRSHFIEFNHAEKPEISLIVEVSASCRDTIQIQYNTNFADSILDGFSVPNIFTPNGDGRNDWFEINMPTGFLNCSELVVYNRWGELIFQSQEGTIRGWDGRTPDGKPASEGTYFYILKYGEEQYKGSVTLIR